MTHGIAKSFLSEGVASLEEVSIQRLITRKQSSNVAMTNGDLADRDLTIFNIIQQGSPGANAVVCHSEVCWGECPVLLVCICLKGPAVPSMHC